MAYSVDTDDQVICISYCLINEALQKSSSTNTTIPSCAKYSRVVIFKLL